MFVLDNEEMAVKELKMISLYTPPLIDDGALVRHLNAFNLNVYRDGSKVTRYRQGRFRAYAPQVCPLGYTRFQAIVDGKRRSFSLHRLLAMAFIPNPEFKPEVNHIDGNKSNSDLSNLEWVTKQENMDHASRTGLWNKDMAWAKSKQRDIDIKKDFISGLSRVELCLKYNLQRPNLNRIVKKCA